MPWVTFGVGSQNSSGNLTRLFRMPRNRKGKGSGAKPLAVPNLDNKPRYKTLDLRDYQHLVLHPA